MTKELYSFIGNILDKYDLTEVDNSCLNNISGAIEEGVTFGRVSVLRDFDNMCKADAFLDFTDTEWQAIKKFFAFNKAISNWDKEEFNENENKNICMYDHDHSKGECLTHN